MVAIRIAGSTINLWQEWTSLEFSPNISQRLNRSCHQSCPRVGTWHVSRDLDRSKASPGRKTHTFLNWGLREAPEQNTAEISGFWVDAGFCSSTSAFLHLQLCMNVPAFIVHSQLLLFLVNNCLSSCQLVRTINLLVGGYPKEVCKFN